MSSNSTNDNLAELLDYAQSRLSEGDYLRVADLLKDIHRNPSDPPTPQKRLIKTVIRKRPVVVHISFRTIQGVLQRFCITKYISVNEHFVTRQTDPNRRVVFPPELKHYIDCTINGKEFNMMPRVEFAHIVRAIITTHGCKELERDINNIVEKFDTLGRFKSYQVQVDRSLQSPNEQIDEDYDQYDGDIDGIVYDLFNFDSLDDSLISEHQTVVETIDY